MAFPQITRITDEKCSVCGSRFRYARIGDKHTNGQWREYVEYECNALLEYSPNFNQVVVNRQCPKAHEVLLKERAERK